MIVKSCNNGYMPSVLDSFLNESVMNEKTMSFTRPDFNVYETEKEFVIEAAVPGLEKKYFKIDIDDNILKISSEKEVKDENEDQKYFYRGFNYGSFNKSYSLPDNVIKEKITASYNDGILKVMIPKNVEVKLVHQIKIS